MRNAWTWVRLAMVSVVVKDFETMIHKQVSGSIREMIRQKSSMSTLDRKWRFKYGGPDDRCWVLAGGAVRVRSCVSDFECRVALRAVYTNSHPR